MRPLQRRAVASVFLNVNKLAGLLLLSVLAAGCFSGTSRTRVVEAPDPEIGDLRAAVPRLTLLEALHYNPDLRAQR